MDDYMEKIANLLGLEIGETFRVGNNDSLKSYYFRFTNIGLEFSTSNEDDVWVTADSYTLFSLLRGELAVIKSPWKPKIDEAYYIPRPDNVSRFAVARWQGGKVDFYRQCQGLVCKSASEAIDVAKKMIIALQEENEDE